MFQKLLDEWLKENVESGDFQFSMMQIFAMYKFAEWLDSRSPTLRAADEFCPRCKSYMPVDAVECANCGFNSHQTRR